jgi:dipeptidyl-peptidase-4
LPRFAETVQFVRTREFWDPEVEEMAKSNLWNTAEWPRFYNVGSDRGYHYLGSARIYYRMGVAFAEAMLRMHGGPDNATSRPSRASDAGDDARFDPVVREIEGWRVHIDPGLLEGAHRNIGTRALTMLANHLQRIAILVPDERLARMRTLQIWIERDHPTLRSMQYHPSVGWLRSHGHDPRLAKKVHIPRAASLLERHQMVKHPAVVLHELAHAYHDQYLGFDDARIIEAYTSAKDGGTYDRVLLYNGKTVRHYGMTDHKEYFAEGTEAYIYRNDFYPFCRAELAEHDPALHELLVEIWGPLQ